MTADDAVTQWYMIFLSALSMGLALLTLGLVHGWGQRVPHWVPRIGGRRMRRGGDDSVPLG